MSKYNKFIKARNKLNEIKSEGVLQKLEEETSGYFKFLLDRAEIIIRNLRLADFNELRIIKLDEHEVQILADKEYALQQYKITIKQSVFEIDEDEFKQWIDDCIINKDIDYFQYKLKTEEGKSINLKRQLEEIEKEIIKIKQQLENAGEKKEVYIPKVEEY